MKKVTFLLATLLIGGTMLTGCKKTEPTPNPEPTPTTYTVVYKVDNNDPFSGLTMSPCFKVNVTYTDANGQSVTESNATLPWSKSIEVTLPFHAKMDGTFTFNEADLPDQVVFGKRRGIGLYTNSSGNVEMTGGMGSASKENFLSLVAEHPDHLQFTEEKDF